MGRRIVGRLNSGADRTEFRPRQYPSPVVLLAELEVFCSRPHAPTRRVALGTSALPVEPAPGYGGVLLGGVVANFIADIDPDFVDDLRRLTKEVETGRRIAQPRLRHRLQVDTIGLNAARHRLVGEGERLAFEFDDYGAPEQQVLGAVYAVSELPLGSRRSVMDSIRRAISWRGPIGADLIATLAGMRIHAGSSMAIGDPTKWALVKLGFVDSTSPSPKEVSRRYRELLREVHPDHGAANEGAAQRIAELGEARRILTGR